MKLEYLAEGSRDCPLFRLYEFNQAEARTLRNLAKSLATGELKLSLDVLPSIRGFNSLIVCPAFGSVQSVLLIGKYLRRSRQMLGYRVATQTGQPRP